MKKLLNFAAVAVGAVLSVSVCADDVISLPTANLKNSPSLKFTLEKRRTSRTFSSKALSELEISNLLWAAYGINRPASGKRTIPAARGIYAVEMYVALQDGVYKHNPGDNSLKKISDKDMRGESDGRKMGAQAPLVLVMVADNSAFSGKGSLYIAVEAGAIMQNVYLYCAGYGYNTVVCGSFNAENWKKELKLPENKSVILTQVVGCKR